MYLFLTDYRPEGNFDLDEVKAKINALNSPLKKKAIYVVERLHFWRESGQMENSWEMGTDEEMVVNGQKVLAFSDDEGLNHMAAFVKIHSLYPKLSSDLGFTLTEQY